MWAPIEFIPHLQQGITLNAPLSQNVSPEAQPLLDRLAKFMDEFIYPNEEAYAAQLNAMENRFATVPLMEELKAKAIAV